MGPGLRLGEDEGQALGDVEECDPDDNMRRDCEAAADAYQAMQMEQMRQANERRR